jgi:hypothetical protein
MSPGQTSESRRMAAGNTTINELILVECVPRKEVNYSLLHNNGELLRKLTLTKLVAREVQDITVQVELSVGAETYPFRGTILMMHGVQLDLSSFVKIPLTGNLPRSLRERVQSTVYVKVTCEGRTAFEHTMRVTLIPVDEWLDDTKNNPWLPSFVLPRDPAILTIISSSRRYLVGITDDPAAGFDGYQQESAAVDKQVQAVWTASSTNTGFNISTRPRPIPDRPSASVRQPSF